MSIPNNPITTLFLIVLCYGITVPTVSNSKKNVVTTVKKDK
jgi:hypothetical protein